MGEKRLCWVDGDDIQQFSMTMSTITWTELAAAAAAATHVELSSVAGRTQSMERAKRTSKTNERMNGTVHGWYHVTCAQCANEIFVSKNKRLIPFLNKCTYFTCIPITRIAEKNRTSKGWDRFPSHLCTPTSYTHPTKPPHRLPPLSFALHYEWIHPNTYAHSRTHNVSAVLRWYRKWRRWDAHLSNTLLLLLLLLLFLKKFWRGASAMHLYNRHMHRTLLLLLKIKSLLIHFAHLRYEFPFLFICYVAIYTALWNWMNKRMNENITT